MDEHVQKCKQCSYQLQFDASQEIKSCPRCGSNELQHQLSLELRDGARLSEMLKGKMKDDRLPSRKKLRAVFATGVEPQKADGRLVYKEDLIDKNKNLRREKVVDLETGRIIHECDESLTEHHGHGSAKKKNNTPITKEQTY